MLTKANKIMTKDPVVCTPNDSLQSAAQMMIDCDCGAIPVVESKENMKLAGVITDRDITCRAVAQGKSPQSATVAECLSQPVVSVGEDTTLRECLRLMEMNQVRRLPVVDNESRCVGIITQAQIARHASAKQIAELLKDVSKKTEEPSHVRR